MSLTGDQPVLPGMHVPLPTHPASESCCPGLAAIQTCVPNACAI